MHILIVEDERKTREYLQKGLGESGYVVGFLFLPAGIVLGAIAGGIWLGRRRA